MKQFLKEFIALERNISEKKGPFNLFALFLRDSGVGDWDVAVAAPWIDVDRTGALKYIGSRIRKEIPHQAFMNISFIPLVDQDNPMLDELLNELEVEHGTVEFKNREFFGKQMKHAYIITCQRAGAHAELAGK